MQTETKIITKEALPALATQIVEQVKSLASASSVVIALHGDLGAGKTTFVQSLAKVLGVTDQVTSPTFTIMKGYETADENFTHLIHMDAYRIDDISELGPLRFADILATPNTLFCIEWAEKIKEALPAPVLNLTLEVVDENTRTVHISRD